MQSLRHNSFGINNFCAKGFVGIWGSAKYIIKHSLNKITSISFVSIFFSSTLCAAEKNDGFKDDGLSNFIEISEQSNWNPLANSWYWRTSITADIGISLPSIIVFFNGKESIYTNSPWLKQHENYNKAVEFSTSVSPAYNLSVLLEFNQVWSQYFSPYLSFGPFFSFISIDSKHQYDFTANNKSYSYSGYTAVNKNDGLGSFYQKHTMNTLFFNSGFEVNLGAIYIPYNFYPLTLIKTLQNNKFGACLTRRQLVFTDYLTTNTYQHSPNNFYSSADFCYSLGYSLQTELYKYLTLGLGYEYTYESIHENPSGYILFSQHKILANINVNF